MATYTPNLNLGKPESTDPFGNFRQLFNDNMDILDNGGGGGSGGHTIVNENGTDMPAEGKLQFIGGVTVTDDSVNGKTVVDISGGGGNVYGAFIDPNNIIAQSISFNRSNPITYTASEDCMVEIYNDNASGLEYYVDTVAMYFINSGSFTLPLPLKKGQTLTSSSGNSYSGAYSVYGLQQGTNQVGVHYSTTEQVIGTWIDGKPLYQISVSLTSGIAIGSYGHISLPADLIVRGFDGYAYRNSHASVDKFNGFINSGDLYASIRNGDIEYWISNIFNPVEEIEFTVQYTKVTD